MPFVLCAAILLGWADPAPSVHTEFARLSDAELLKMVQDRPSLVVDKDDSDCTALHFAARYGRVETARWLIAQGADVNTVAYNGFRPLHVVEEAAVAKLLIAAGAKLDAVDNWGKTPLQRAAQMERTDVCDAILAAGYPIDLASALWLGRRDVAKKLIADHPDRVRKPDQGKDLWGNTTPLGIAAEQGDNEMVKLLLAAGAPVDAPTDRPLAGDLTPLYNAVVAGHYETAQILCAAGANANLTGGRRYRYLIDWADDHADPRMVELLLKHGAKRSSPKGFLTPERGLSPETD
jgi:ankyrin repeat protein